MMVTKFTSILLSISLLLVLSGCWDSKEVTELAIAVALGIDKNDNGEYIVSAQILNPSENAATIAGGSGYDSPVTTYTAKGNILVEAFRKMMKMTPRKVYIAHLRMIVFGEKVAKEGIYDSLDFLSRDAEMRTDYYIVIAKNHTAEDILKVLTSIEKLPSRKLFNSLEDLSEYWAGVEKVRLDKLIDDIVSEGVQPVLTGVTIDGNQQEGENTDNVQTISPNALLVYDNMAAFYKNKMVGWLNEEESKGLNYITDEVEGTLIVLEDINDGVVGIELNNSASEIVPHMKGNTPVFDINITGEADVADVNTKINLMSASVFAELTEKANRDIEEKVIAAINKGQKEFKTDIFGFGERLHKSKPKEWEKLKGSWTEIFPTAEVNVNVNIKIRGTGTILEPFHNELED